MIKTAGTERDFISTIANHPILDREHIIALVLEWQKTKDITLRDKVINTNIKLILHVAYKQVRGAITIEELILPGMEGIIRAMELFDSSKGAAFHNYALVHIRAKIIRYVDFETGVVRVPVSTQHGQTRMPPWGLRGDGIRIDHLANEETTPPHFELADITAGQDLDVWENIKEARHLTQHVSDFQRELLNLRFWEEEKYQDIADKNGISRENARLKITRTLKQLKAAYEEPAET